LRKITYTNENGSSLAMVVIILSVLTMLSVVLLNMSIQGLVLSKRSKNVDFAYYAGESAIENWFSEIEKKLSTPNVGNDYPSKYVDTTLTGNTPKSIWHYANWLINHYNLNSLSTQYIDISHVASPVAGISGAKFSEVKFEGIKIGNVVKSATQADEIIITFEMVANSKYFPEFEPYQAGNKEIFAKRDIIVKIPLPSKGFLTGAIFSIRDFYVSGTINSKDPLSGDYSLSDYVTADIKGDVSVFGSYTDVKSTSQYGYGGIYALNNAKINIDGNAYSRSLIRAGRYGTSDPIEKTEVYFVDAIYPDNSEIRIKKDAIAQSLHIFGAKDKIVAYRNVYTLDDMEINGIDSVLAVNGSFFGLSRGGPTSNHDESSAIVNSAVVHHMFDSDVLEEAKKSRVVINGDVIVGGGTFKVKANGTKIGQIEDVSVVWNNLGYPYYKDSVDADFDPDPNLYHSKLRAASNISAPFNIFQKWFPKDTESEIENWLIEIDNERKGLTVIFDNNPGVLRGFWNYEVAANDKLYMNADAGISVYPTTNDFTQNLYCASNYWIDNIFNGENTLKFKEDYWNDIDTLPEIDYELVFRLPYSPPVTPTPDPAASPAPTPKVPPSLDQLKQELEAHIEQLANRDYAGSDWIVNDTGKFNEMLKAIDDKDDAWSSNPYYLCIENNEAALPDSINIKDALGFDIYAECLNDTDRDEEYYLIVNKDPKIELVVSGYFNGIIFTTGRVKLEEGANIYGSIVSAGGGSYNATTNDFEVDVSSIKVSDTPDKIKELDEGKLAGVYFKATGAGVKKVAIDFYLGKTYTEVINEGKSIDSTLVPVGQPEKYYLNQAARLNLLKKFEDNSIDLYDIF